MKRTLLGAVAKLGIARAKPKKKQPSLIREVIDTPENFKLEAFIENDEIVLIVKRKKSKNA